MKAIKPTARPKQLLPFILIEDIKRYWQSS